MKYLSIYFQDGFDGSAEPRYSFMDIDCEMFTRPDDKNDVILVNGAVIRLPGCIVDVRPRVKTGKKDS